MKNTLTIAVGAATFLLLCFVSNQLVTLNKDITTLIQEDTMITKTSTWWCPSSMSWETVTYSGTDPEKVCETFRALKAAGQEECPPGTPPALPPGMEREER